MYFNRLEGAYVYRFIYYYYVFFLTMIPSLFFKDDLVPIPPILFFHEGVDEVDGACFVREPEVNVEVADDVADFLNIPPTIVDFLAILAFATSPSL